MVIIDLLIILLTLIIVTVISSIIFLFKGEVQSIVPKYIKKKYKFRTREIRNRKVFMMSSNDESTNKIILYLHGGSYVGAMNSEHWRFLSDIIDDTGVTIVIPDYPLTPKYNYKDVFNMIEPLYQEILEKKKNNKFILMGDSAGGGMALSLIQKINEKNRTLPDYTILLSPWLDVTMKNPDILEIADKDPVLNKLALMISGEHYSGTDGKDSYLVNPINGPLEGLKNIVIFTGTYDMLNADARLLVEKATEKNINIDIKEYENAIHIWMMNRHSQKNIHKAEEAYEDIITLLKEI